MKKGQCIYLWRANGSTEFGNGVKYGASHQRCALRPVLHSLRLRPARTLKALLEINDLIFRNPAIISFYVEHEPVAAPQGVAYF